MINSSIQSSLLFKDTLFQASVCWARHSENVTTIELALTALRYKRALTMLRNFWFIAL